MTSPAEAWERIKPFAMNDLGELLGQFGGSNNPDEGAGLILLYDVSAGVIEEYSYGQAGFAGAIAAAESNDTIFVPSGQISGNHTIPSSVHVFGVGYGTHFSGTITNSSGSSISMAQVNTLAGAGEHSYLVEETSRDIFLITHSESNLVIGNIETFDFTTGNENILIGNLVTDSLITTGSQNIVMGQSAGAAITTGSLNVLIGFDAGGAIDEGRDNICIGNQAGNSITSGDNNTYIGDSAGASATTGDDNVCIGETAGSTITTGQQNTIVGNESSTVTTGTHNVIVGFATGLGLQGGSKNTIIGSGVSGLSGSLANTVIIADGDGNQRIFIDSNGLAGINETTPVSRLHVTQESTTAAKQVVTLDQSDIDEPIWKLIGTATFAEIDRTFVSSSDVSAATAEGYVKVEIQDDGNQITDGDYFLAVYSLTGD